MARGSRQTANGPEAAVALRIDLRAEGVDFAYPLLANLHNRRGDIAAICERLLDHGVLAKDTHGATIRLAPPLTVHEDDLRWAVGQLAECLGES